MSKISEKSSEELREIAKQKTRKGTYTSTALKAQAELRLRANPFADCEGPDFYADLIANPVAIF